MDERTKTGAPRPPEMRLGALYAAAVVGLAVFLSLALLFPGPIRFYSARAVVEQTVGESEHAATEMPVLTQSSAERIARDAYASTATEDVSDQRRAFGETVHCQVERLTPYRVRVAIEARDRFADRSLALCKRITAEIVDRQPTSFLPGQDALRSQRSDVERRLALARESRRAFEDELTSLEREYLADFSTAMQRVVAAQAGNGSVETTSLTLPAEYVQIEAEFRELMAVRREMTRSWTSDHPRVRDIDDRLAAAKVRLDTLAPAVRSAAAQSGDSTAAKRNALEQLESLQDEFRRKSQIAADAIALGRRREEELASEAARLTTSPEPVAVYTQVAEEPQVVDRVGGEPSTARLGVFGTLALAAASLAYGLLRHISARKILRSADDIHAQLGMPVVSLVGRHSIQPPSRLESTVRRSVLVAEVLLLTLALAAASLVACQSQLTEPVGSDPFGAVAESWDRSFSSTIRR